MYQKDKIQCILLEQINYIGLTKKHRNKKFGAFSWVNFSLFYLYNKEDI